ncbi:MAG: hypothetical protein NUV82_00785 [Candidatus Komeilibacteria bacterium]|nr:hypothetical protein [Candidatus Komeilibacteria bacterium]
MMIKEKNDGASVSKQETDLLRTNGINPETYEKYVDVFQAIDMPLVNSLPDWDSMFVQNTVSPEEEYKHFLPVAERYLSIDDSILSEETGRDIVIKVKALLKRLFFQMEKYLFYEAEKRPVDAKASAQALKIVLGDILTETKKFNQLPAYQAYRLHWKYKKNISRN